MNGSKATIRVKKAEVVGIDKVKIWVDVNGKEEVLTHPTAMTEELVKGLNDLAARNIDFPADQLEALKHLFFDAKFRDLTS